MTLLWKGAVINSMPKIFRKFHKGLALALSAAMCVSLSSVPAFAAETTVLDEEGRVIQESGS